MCCQFSPVVGGRPVTIISNEGEKVGEGSDAQLNFTTLLLFGALQTFAQSATNKSLQLMGEKNKISENVAKDIGKSHHGHECRCAG